MPAGSEYVESAIRKLDEELGIEATPNQLHFNIEELSLQESEVEEVRWDALVNAITLLGYPAEFGKEIAAWRQKKEADWGVT